MPTSSNRNFSQLIVVALICFIIGFAIPISSSTSHVMSGPCLGRNETGKIDGSVLKYNDTSGLWEVGVDGASGNPFNQNLNTTDDVQFADLTFGRFFQSSFGGAIDAGGDPWYLSGTSFQIAENLTVDNNITASYFIGNGSQLTGISSGNPFNQDLNTTNAASFTSLNTGQGANELYDMNQNVQTTDDVTFNNVSITDNITIANGANTWIIYVDGNGTLVWEIKP